MRFFFFFLLFLCSFEIKAQTRVFFAVGHSSAIFGARPNFNLGLQLQGSSVFLGTESTDYTFGRYPRVDLTVERRLFGPYYWMSGVKFTQTGYRYADEYHTSRLRNYYLSIPLLLRVNLYNGNVIYVDVGFLQNVLLYSDLKESFDGTSDHQNIAPYTSRLSTCFYFELSYNYRRWGLSAFFQSRSLASSRDFSLRWKIDANHSYFLLFNRNYYFSTNGIKLTFRLK